MLDINDLVNDYINIKVKLIFFFFGLLYKMYVMVMFFESFILKLNKCVFSDKNKEKSINCLDYYVYNIIN